MYVCMHVCMHVHTFAICKSKFVGTSVCRYVVCLSVCMYLHMYTYMRAYI